MCLQKIARFGITTLILSSGLLLAENSGFYGSVGFQYSNMTRAQSYTGPTQQAIGSGNSGYGSVGTPLANIPTSPITSNQTQNGSSIVVGSTPNP